MDNQEPPAAETHAYTKGDGEDVTDEQAPNNETVDQRVAWEEQLSQCLHHNRQGIGGNINYHRNDRAPYDPFAKVKFIIPIFLGAYDVDAYLDWEMTVKQ